MPSHRQNIRPPAGFLGLLLFAATAVFGSALAEGEWLTVLAVGEENEDLNIYKLLMSRGVLNDEADKEALSPPSIVAKGNFKSNLTDHWPVLMPAKVRVALYDKDGYMVWFTDFSGPSDSKDPAQWMTVPAIDQSSDRKLTASASMTIAFEEETLDIRTKDSVDIRLVLTWDPQPLAFLLSTQQWRTTSPPLQALASPLTNMEMVLAQASIDSTTYFSFTSGSTYWMSMTQSRYLAGMGLRKNASVPGEVRQFTMQMTLDPACMGRGTDHLYHTLCHPGTSDPVVFIANYSHGADNSLALFAFEVTVAAFCMKIFILDASPNHHTSIYVYDTEHTALEAATFGILWWIDTSEPEETTMASSCTVMTVCEDDVTSPDGVTSSVTELLPLVTQNEKERIRDEIQQTLGVTKQNTSRFKRQFISVPDHRPSAVAIGVLGVSVIVVVVVSIVVLDFRTLSLQLRALVSRVKKHLHRRSAKVPELRSSGLGTVTCVSPMPAADSMSTTPV